VGLPHLLYGECVQIKPEDIPDVEKQPRVIESAVDAGKLLGLRLKNGHDRQAVTKKMQEKMMSLLKSSV